MQFVEHSVIAYPPKLLDVQQRRFFAGIRHAVLAMDVSYARLLETIEIANSPSGWVSRHGSAVVLFTDAWSIVDNGRRLQRLLWKLPNLSSRDAIQRYVSAWRSLRSLRDVSQHADRDYADHLYAGNYVYGSLYWVDYRRKKKDGEISAVTQNAGPEANYGEFDDPFPAPIIADSDRDDIYPVILRAGGHDVNLSDLLLESQSVVKDLDDFATGAYLKIAADIAVTEPEKAANMAKRLKVDSSMQVVAGPIIYGDDEQATKRD